MIISLRGTNGAGKSTLVRRVMDQYAVRLPITAEGRRRPVGYHLMRTNDPPHDVDLFIPGHYEIANGGIDTIKDIYEAYEMIIKESLAGRDVLYEGKNMSDSWRKASTFLPKDKSVIVFIKEPLETCIAGVRARGHSIKEETISKLWEKQKRDAVKLKEIGYHVEEHDREGAYSLVTGLLDLEYT